MTHPAPPPGHFPPGQPPPGYPPPGYPPQGYGPPGYPQPPGAPRKSGFPVWAIVLLICGGGIVVVGVLAAVAIPSFLKYTRRAKATEAAPNVKRIYDGARAYYEARAPVDASGERRPLQFPGSVGITPTKPCCRHSGDRCFGTDWSHATWKALKFGISGRHFFRYRFSARGQGPSAMFTAGAHADLDCDGIYSTYERTGTVDADNRVVGGASVFVRSRYE